MRFPRPLASLRTLLHPEGFHGAGRRGRFFEGWYHKLVGPGGASLALIPGWFQGEDEERRFAFLMVFDGGTETVRIVRFPAAEFHAASDRYDLRLGSSRFTAERLELDVDTPQLRLRGAIDCTNTHPWPVTLRAPGVMGWYGYVPLMQCWHGIVSLDHGLRGELELDGRRIALDGGRGYTEKDWGSSFPDAWVWLQANDPTMSVTASVATIPWAFGRTFAGFLVGVLHRGQLYRFTTYTGARIEHLEVDSARVRWVLRSRTHRLELEALRGPAEVLLPAPDLNDMVAKVPESLGVTIRARLLTRDGETIASLESDTGALEVMGDMARLRRLLKLR